VKLEGGRHLCHALFCSIVYFEKPIHIFNNLGSIYAGLWVLIIGAICLFPGAMQGRNTFERRLMRCMWHVYIYVYIYRAASEIIFQICCSVLQRVADVARCRVLRRLDEKRGGTERETWVLKHQNAGF